MKKFFVFMAVSLVALAAACSPDDGADDSQAVLKLTSESVMRFMQDGGEGVINYTLENVGSNAKIQAVCVSEWITITEVGNVVAFTVAPNDTVGERTALIIVSYKNQSVQVIVEQQGAPDVEFFANKLNGRFEKKGSGHPNAYKYTIVLSKYGTTSATDHYAGDNYYHFDIYSTVPAASDPYLAWGEYVFDANNSYEPGTFSSDRSEFVSVDDEGNASYLRITGGKIVVVEGNINALITLEDNTVHHIVYNGSLQLFYFSEVSKGPYSTIEGDYEFNIVDGAMMLLYDGDDYGTGRGSWEIRFMERADLMAGDFFRFPVIVESLGYDEELVYRTFTADTASSFAALTFSPGYKNDGDLYGSWYLPVNEGYFSYTAAAIAGGSFTVTRDGEEAIVTVDTVDDLGHKVKGTCHCKYIEAYDRTNM